VRLQLIFSVIYHISLYHLVSLTQFSQFTIEGSGELNQT